MKKKSLFVLATLLAMGVLMFSACNNNDAGETETMAGFIEIRGNTLYITPVEVFFLSGGGYVPYDGALRPIEFIDVADTQRMEELGLTIYDFPMGFHIRPNWHADLGWHYVEQADIETLSFRIDRNTTFSFVDSRGLFLNPDSLERHHTTNAVDEFLEYLYPTVVHFIEVQGNRVIRLVQEFGFTI
ncbi:MAG: hypothetical protein FWC93_05615 [Defluviitaleaceae bacterium]|nr:hypothetical protein [Defluviitaleaceae bacterium]